MAELKISVEGYSHEFQALLDNAGLANALLRSLANENRLVILCLLAAGEVSVGQLEAMTGARQPTVSQQLARLRADGLVESRREGKVIYYTLANANVRRILELLDGIYHQSGDLRAPVRAGGQVV
jgi:DNA-binding transcriptional ArsR family regulator